MTTSVCTLYMLIRFVFTEMLNLEPTWILCVIIILCIILCSELGHLPELGLDF